MAKSIHFSSSLYSVEAVKKSAQDYAAIAQFYLDVTDGGVDVTIDNIHPAYKDILVDHFCNHVLNETIILRRQKDGGEL